MIIEIDYAADDSCKIQLWARGNHPDDAFLKMCANEFLDFDGRVQPTEGFPVRHSHWRTVRAPKDLSDCGVCDFIHSESKPGKGAFEVTILDFWFPLHSTDPVNFNPAQSEPT